MAAKTKSLIPILTVLVGLVVSLVSAWALNINVQMAEHDQRLRNQESQTPVIQYKLDLLLKAHGIQLPKEDKK